MRAQIRLKIIGINACTLKYFCVLGGHSKGWGGVGWGEGRNAGSDLLAVSLFLFQTEHTHTRTLSFSHTVTGVQTIAVKILDISIILLKKN